LKEKREVNINPKRIIFFLLCLQNAAISINIAALSAAIPTISKDLALADVLVAKIIPYYMIPYGVGALLYAPLAKKVSAKILMAVTMFLFAVTNFYCASANALAPFLTLRVAMGIVSAGVIPLGLIIIGRTFEADIRGRLVGIFFSCSFAASLAGIVLSGVAHWRWLFLLPGYLGLLAALFILFIKSDTLGKIEGRVDYAGVFRNVKLRNILIFITLISMFYHGVDRWLGVYMARIYHLNQLTISFLFGLIAVSAGVGQNLGGYLTDKKGRFFSCKLGIVMLAGATMLLAGVYPVFILAMVLVVLAVGWTIGHNGASTALTDFPDEYRAEIASLNSSLRFFFGGFGFLLSGLFIEKSFALTFLGIGVLMLFLSVYLRKIIPAQS